MTHSPRSLLLVALLTACTAATPSDHATLDAVPRAASDALKAQAGAAVLGPIHKETSSRGDRYEASWWDDGLEREAKVTADGRLVELETEVRVADVPEAARVAATQALPAGATIKFVKLLDGTYEAEAHVGGKEHEVTVTATGQIVRGDGDDDDEEDDDDEHGDDDAVEGGRS